MPDSPREQYIQLIDHLSEYLGVLKEDGVSTLEVDRVVLTALGHPVASASQVDAPARASAAGTSTVASNAASTVASTVASNAAEPGAPTPTREKAPTPTTPPANHRLQFAIAERMAACGDATPSELHRLVILSETACFEEAPGELLAAILKAGGYELTTEPADYQKTEELYAPGPRALLLMGEAALQALRPRATVMLASGKFKAIDGIETLCTFDTVYIQSNSATKKAVWTHLKMLLKRIDLDVPDWVKKKS